MTLVIIAGIVGYLTAGLFISRVWWQGRKKKGRTDDAEEVTASFMVPFWPLILFVMGCMWIVNHEAPK